MTATTVSSGQTSTGIVLNAGDTLLVSSGGTASSTQIHSGGSETVLGLDVSASISGGSLFVSSGGNAVSTTLTGQGLEVVSAGATATGTVIQQVGGGGSDVVFGTAVSTIVDFGSQTVSSGGVASATTVFGGLLAVGSGGTASGTILSAGSETVAGTDIGGLVSGGQMAILSGGTASNVVVHTPLTVSAGGTVVSGTVIGGPAFVLGTASATTVSSGSFFVSSGGVGTGTVLTGSSLEVVFAGGLASGTIMNQPGNAGTSEVVLGTAIGTKMGAGSQTVSSGGVAINTTVFGGQLIVASSGRAIGAVMSAGSETVLGTDTGARLIGGQMFVSSGGVASATQVGTTLTVSSGGLAVSTTFISGTAAEFVLGTISAATGSSGSIFISSGGSAISNSLTGKAFQVVFAGGSATGTLMQQTGNAGTSEIVLGTETSAIMDAGTLTVSSGGLAAHTTVFAGSMTVGVSGTGSDTVVQFGVETVSGTETGAVVQHGTLAVASGGTVSAATVSGTLNVSSGGLAISSTVVSNGGNATVLGIASSTSVGGVVTISSGGTAISSTLTDHGQQTILAGAVASGTAMGQTGNLGTSEIVFGTAIQTSIQIGSQTVSSGGVASNTSLVNGGTQIVASGGTAVATLIERGFVDLQAGASVSGGVTFMGPGGRLEVDGTAAPQGLVIFGFDPTETIDLPNIVFDANGVAVLQAGNVLHVSEAGGSIDLQLDPNQTFAAGTTFALQNDGNNGTLVQEVPCFCRGTLIAAEHGEVAVESLAVGDRVRTISGELKPIVWIGMGRDLVTRGNKAARPIIVKQGALAKNVPQRDLYLTHGHSLYLDGVLVPVEKLVNHHSILWDETARVVEYYHIELAEHDVLLADGAPAESYHDDGNRVLFQNGRTASDADASKPRYAPVVTEGEGAERAWAKLAKRARIARVKKTTTDPDPHLLIGNTRIEPASAADGTYVFTFDRPALPVQLRSRSTVPSLVGDSRSEHRRLGIAIRQLVVEADGIMTCIEHNARLLRDGGCHAADAGHAWTDGHLVLPSALFACLRGPVTLVVHTRADGLRYPLEAKRRQRQIKGTPVLVRVA